jgi:hypothetical protein
MKRMLVPLRTLKAAFIVGLRQMSSRLTLWFGCYGVYLPWYKWSEANVSSETLERYKRRALVAKLRAQRFKIARGPVFLRGMIERLFVAKSIVQFPSLIAFKFSVALVICLFPFFLFFLVRIYLPVPQRIALSKAWLSLESVNSAEIVNLQILRVNDNTRQTAAWVDEQSEKGSFAFRTINSATAEGLLTQGRGSAHEEYWRGWKLVAEHDLVASLPIKQPLRDLRLKYKFIPNAYGNGQCKIDVMDDIGQVLFAASFFSKSFSENRLFKTFLTRTLQEKLMPEVALFQAGLPDHPVSLQVRNGAAFIKFRMTRLDRGDPRACSVLLYGFEKPRSEIVPVQQPRRSLLMLSFKSMNSDLASVQQVMPWMSSTLRTPQGFIFSQHHAVDLRDTNSLRTLLGWSGTPVQRTETSPVTLFEQLKVRGYKTIIVGDFNPADFQFQVIPDIVIRIENETYEPRLVLSHLLKILENESTTPLFVLVRLNGLQMPWQPVFSDLEFKQLFWGGGQRGLMDTLLFSHAKSLDKELQWHFGELNKLGLFSKFDFIATAEKGMDLGLSRARQDATRITLSSDLLLNQDSLKVPLVFIPAHSRQGSEPGELQYVQDVTTHRDLLRTLWEMLGVLDAKFPVDARRLWKDSLLIQGWESKGGRVRKDSHERMQVVPLYSRLQDGVLFADPDASGSFLKYVSQTLPAQVSVYDVYGWPRRQKLNFPAGEQFRQVSKRGTREEVLGRVSGRFYRESRRIIKSGQRSPLHLTFEFHDAVPVDLILQESVVDHAKLRATLPTGLQLQSRRVGSSTVEHHITGRVFAGEKMELQGGLNQIQFLRYQIPASLVACPETYFFTPPALAAAVSQKSVCLFEAPDSQWIRSLRTKGHSLISVLLVEDANKICQTQFEGSGNGTEEESSGCEENDTPESLRN